MKAWLKKIWRNEATQAQRQGELPILPPASEASMQDYYQIQSHLLTLTAIFCAVIFLSVWRCYSLNTAFNYLLGAATGVVYLKMLSKSVSQIGRENPGSSSGRLAILIGVLVVSTQWKQLSILPVFLGFLTYKIALIAYVVWTAALPQREVT
jgi:ATP synthase protein I